MRRARAAWAMGLALAALVLGSACGDETDGEGGANSGTSASSSSSGTGGSSSGTGGMSSGTGGSSSGTGGAGDPHTAECTAMCDKAEQLGCNPDASCAQNCQDAAVLAELGGCQTELGALFTCVDQVTDCNAVCDAENQALSQCIEAFCTANPDKCP